MGRMAYHKKVKNDYTQYTCRIKSNVLEKIKEIAKKEGISITDAINQSLEYAIKNYEK